MKTQMQPVFRSKSTTFRNHGHSEMAMRVSTKVADGGDPNLGLNHFGKTNLSNVGTNDFDCTIGSWDQKDPAGFVDGANVYQFVEGNPAASVDPSGWYAVNLNFNAFIPKSLGYPSPSTDYNWGLEGSPGNWFNWTMNENFSNYYYWFGTDNRENAGDKGTSRISTLATIDSANIGNSKDNVTWSATQAASHEINALRMPDGSPAVSAELPSAIKAKTGKVSSSESNSDTSPTCTDIHIDASGADPFFVYSPDIVIDITWHLCRNANGSVNASVTGDTSKFPAYEGIANGTLVWESRPPPGSGPNGWNLGHGRPKAVVASGVKVI